MNNIRKNIVNERHKEVRLRLLPEAEKAIGASKGWHWFHYHFSVRPLHRFAQSILDACVDCELRIEGLGFQFIHEIALIQGKEKYRPHYDQLMQKLAELFVLRQLLGLDWPQGTAFEHEPAAIANGKRPELRVMSPERAYLFEVKTPSLLEHIEARNRNRVQAPGRAIAQNLLEKLANGGGLTLPRDNPVKDFLIDADKKFSQFKAVSPYTSMLVIVWDDHIYEPITVLTHQECGLLNSNSYYKDAAGTVVQFTNIDAVILIRHLNYLRNAAADKPLGDRFHALDFGAAHDLPNVFIPISAQLDLPVLIQDGLRARPLDDPACQHAAEYRPQDIVLWL